MALLLEPLAEEFLIYLRVERRLSPHTTRACESACNNDPPSGVIGVEN